MTRILVVRLGSLGDIVHAMPAVAALGRTWPSASIDWATAPVYEGLAGMLRGLRRVIPVNTRRMRGPAGVIPVVRALRAARYDLVLDFQGLLKSAVLARLAGGARTLGYAPPDLREPAAALFYSGTVDVSGATHIIDKGLALAAGAGVVAGPARFDLDVPDLPEARALAARTVSGGYALLNPGAAWPNKRWMPARFAEVARELRRSRGLSSVVLWGPGEREGAEAVVAASDGAAELAPAVTIPGVAALARGARVMISGDTGPLHLAAAVGTPVVSLFGPTRAERNGPWDPADVAISRLDQCACVYERRCRRDTPCIASIATDEVLAATQLRLDRAEAGR